MLGKVERRSLPDTLDFEIVYNIGGSEPEELIAELHSTGWIKKHQNSKFLILGKGIVRETYFAVQDPSSIAELLVAHLERYSKHQREIIEATFKRLGSYRRTGTMTDLQKKAELEYYTKYPTSTIERACVIFLGLGTDSKYSPEYLRGIIRNQPVESMPVLHTGQTVTHAEIKPTESLVTRQNRQAIIRQKFQERGGPNLSIREQVSLLESIESEVE